jgi:aquaporin Z
MLLETFAIEVAATYIFVMVILMTKGNPLAVGGTLVLLIYFLSASVNPAASLGVALTGKMDSTLLVAILAQLLGAISAAFVYKLSSKK